MTTIEFTGTGFVELRLVDGQGNAVARRVDLILFFNELIEAGHDPAFKSIEDTPASVRDRRRAEFLGKRDMPGVSATVAHLLVDRLAQEVADLKKAALSPRSAGPPASTGSPPGPDPTGAAPPPD